MIMKLGKEYYELKLYTVHINDDPGLTLTYFTPMLNLAKLVFVPRYQVSVYRIIGPLVLYSFLFLPNTLYILLFLKNNNKKQQKYNKQTNKNNKQKHAKYVNLVGTRI